MTPRPCNPLAERSAKLSRFLNKVDTLPKMHASYLESLLRVLGNVAEHYYSLDETTLLAKAIFNKTDDICKPVQAGKIMDTLAQKYTGDMTGLAVDLVELSPPHAKVDVACECAISMLKFGHTRFEGIFNDKLKDGMLNEGLYINYQARMESSKTYLSALNLNKAIAVAEEELGLTEL